MPKHLKKLSEEVVNKNPWWEYKHDTYEKPDGSAGDYFYGETQGNVMVVPVLPDGRIGLVLQFRYLMQKQSIEFPCGGLKEGDTPQDHARRELQEETGYHAGEFMKVGSFQALNGFIKDECHLFIASVEDEGVQALEDTEEIEVLTRRPEEIDVMVRRGEIWDGQTLAAWAMVRHHFLKSGGVRSEEDTQERPLVERILG